MARAFLVVLDSVGVGGAPDAAAFGDEGANTLGHIAEACMRGEGDRDGLRQGPLKLPHMARLGLAKAAELVSGTAPPGLEADGEIEGAWGCASEVSSGKDTPSGHWEIAGLPVTKEWRTFPRTEPTFPESLTRAMIAEGDIPGILGNCHASGTEIIADLGNEHMKTGKPIVYTSIDSVVQIAAHEEFFGLDRLYDLCAVTRRLVDPLGVQRVVARPFIGKTADDFERTGNRRDYSVPPPGDTLLDIAEGDDRAVFAVGKIADIFAHRGVTDIRKANGNDAMFDAMLQVMDDAANGDFTFVNFVDFDQLYGHRRDVPGYAACLEHFDARLPQALAKLRAGDLLVITADHGNDPTWRGNDHTRERVPVLMAGPDIAAGNLGISDTFADIGASVAAHLDLPPLAHGKTLL